MKKMTVKLAGEELNERLDRQMLLIERIGILLDDAKLDVNDEMALDGESMHSLLELLSAYDAFLEHFRNTTEDTVSTIKQLTTVPGNQSCSCEEERDIDLDVDEENGE
jgi:hypothetical protein